MEVSKKTLRRIFLGVAGCIILYWLLHETATVARFGRALWGLVAPFFAGAIVAFVLNVPMRGIERRLGRIKRAGVRRGLAMILTLVAVVLVLVLMWKLLMPQIERTVESLISSLPAFWKRVETWANQLLEKHPDEAEFLRQYTSLETFDWPGFLAKAMAWVEAGVTTVVNSAFSVVGSVVNGVIHTIISLAFSMYALARKETLAHQARMLLYGWLPEKWADRILRVARLTNSTFSSFISGQCVEACIFGCLVAVTMWICGMPFVPLVGALAAVTALVPMVGAAIGWILGALFILVQSPMQAVWYLILYQVDQQIEDNLIYPRVVGSSIGLPSIWVLVAVTVGGMLSGVVGMILMIPLASVLYSLLRELTQARLEKKGTAPEKLEAQKPEEFRASLPAPTGIWRSIRALPEKVRTLPRRLKERKKGAPPENGGKSGDFRK